MADDDEGKADSAPGTEAPEEVTPAVKQVRIVCGSGSVNIRVGNDAEYGRIRKERYDFRMDCYIRKRLARRVPPFFVSEVKPTIWAKPHLLISIGAIVDI